MNDLRGRCQGTTSGGFVRRRPGIARRGRRRPRRKGPPHAATGAIESTSDAGPATGAGAGGDVQPIASSIGAIPRVRVRAKWGMGE
jgi:hypothetical protein